VIDTSIIDAARDRIDEQRTTATVCPACGGSLFITAVDDTGIWCVCDHCSMLDSGLHIAYDDPRFGALEPRLRELLERRAA